MAKVRLLDPSDSKRRLDRYELIGELASGGMATVFLGRLGGVGGFQRFVAIKRLHPHLASEEEFIEMFLDEARLAAGIHHPHVVPILEVGESDSGYYLVMEYVEGDTLARLMARALARAQPIPRPVLIRIVLDALAGLHAAHELIDGDGNPVLLVHRDVSPQNILVGVDGASRITDFGVAHAAARLQNTRADRLKGKLAYMSPEQARAGEVDRRADVFAMGIILWEVLAAKRLFKSESEAVTLQRVTVEPIPRLSSVVPGMHPALDQEIRAVARLDRDRNRRYPSAADFAEALERAARDAASASATDLGVASPREVAAYIQGALGEDIAAQRESVRAWLAHGEPSSPKLGAVRAPAWRPLAEARRLRRDHADPARPRHRGGGGGNCTPAARKPPAHRWERASGTPQERAPPRPSPSSSPITLGGERRTRCARPPALPFSPPEPRPVSPQTPPQGHAVPPVAFPVPPQGGRPMAPAIPPAAPAGISLRSVRVGSSPDVREALGISHGTPLLSADGASLDEAPVEPRDDDEDDHETQLMDRDEAVAELVRRKALPSQGLRRSRSQPSASTPVPSAVGAGERSRLRGHAQQLDRVVHGAGAAPAQPDPAARLALGVRAGHRRRRPGGVVGSSTPTISVRAGDGAGSVGLAQNLEPSGPVRFRFRRPSLPASPPRRMTAPRRSPPISALPPADAPRGAVAAPAPRCEQDAEDRQGHGRPPSWTPPRPSRRVVTAQPPPPISPSREDLANPYR